LAVDLAVILDVEVIAEVDIEIRSHTNLLERRSEVGRRSLSQKASQSTIPNKRMVR
jgi:hypothetical protein